MKERLTRGAIVLTRFPFTDLSGTAVRPALVVSAGTIGQDVVLAGISSVLRGGTIATDLVVDSTHPEFRQTRLPVPLVMRLHKLATVELTVIVRRLGRIGRRLQDEVDRVLRTVIGV